MDPAYYIDGRCADVKYCQTNSVAKIKILLSFTKHFSETHNDSRCPHSSTSTPPKVESFYSQWNVLTTMYGAQYWNVLTYIFFLKAKVAKVANVAKVMKERKTPKQNRKHTRRQQSCKSSRSNGNVHWGRYWEIVRWTHINQQVMILYFFNS